MKTPLYTSLRKLADQNTARFHMPGHKGLPVFEDFGNIFSIDFTETYDTGNLYEQQGTIRDAEKLCATYFSAADCNFLTGGSSQGVQAMLGAICGDGGHVLLDRTCHKSAMHACALFDLTPTFVLPDFLTVSACTGTLNLAAVESMLKQNPDIRAFMTVSPNYYGVLQPIDALATLCHTYGVKLLVDCAHGAHLPAVGIPSPIAQGADVAVLSAHKTLPALGQGAYLLLSESVNADNLRWFESLCGTSSPSYPIMASLDLARNALQENSDAYSAAVTAVNRLRNKYDGAHGLRALTNADAPLDPLRFTISCKNGLALSDRLYAEFGVAAEMADHHNVVFIVTPQDLASNLNRLENALDILADDTVFTPPTFLFPPAPIRVRSVRSALLSAGVPVPAEQAVGKICARAVTPYPPGVPLLWPGEEIGSKHIEFLTERCYNVVGEITICPD